MASTSKPGGGTKAEGRTIFQFSELQSDGTPGRSISFTLEQLQPLGYEELATARSHEKLRIPLEFDRSSIVETDIELDRAELYNARMMLESKFTSRAIGLVRGGWLPSALAASIPNAVVLLDRNVVSDLVGRFNDRKRIGDEPDFLDLFANAPIQINPILFAIEGNSRGTPTPELVRSQLEEVTEKLRKALPRAQLVVGPHSLDGALGLIEESRRGLEQKQQFLSRLAPILATPISREKVRARWNDVVSAADQCGVARDSLVVLAALSVVVTPNGQSPARNLLKFRKDYSDSHAYNALSDLLSLDLLIHMFAMFPEIPAVLCTADRSLALFWTALRASNFERHGRAVSFDLCPAESLLPAAYTDEWRSSIG